MATAIQDIPLKTIEGQDSNLGAYAGKVLLVVNVASKCGLTPQYTALESVFEKYRDQGLVVLGFPANDFGAQEPGTDEEIATFCETQFSVQFPMFSKIEVTGPAKHPLYAKLIEEQPEALATDAFRARLAGFGREGNPPPELLWNFEKFLVGRDGTVVARFSPDMAPDDDRIITAIERELHASE
jgi:glutathione peroxidase